MKKLYEQAISPGDSTRSHSANEYLLDSIIPYLAQDKLVDLEAYESQHQ